MEEDMEVSCAQADQLRTPAPYRHPHHTQKAFDVLNMMRKQALLCDVLIIVDGKEIPAHKSVLSSCSPYFYAMFTNDLSEARSNRVMLQDVDGKALTQLIDFIYTSEIGVTEENVQILLSAANLLQLVEVRNACCEFLQSQLHPSNCLGIKDFADLHACTELMNYAQAYTEQHFSEVVKHDEFLNLSSSQVTELISSDRLSVQSEENVFESVIGWIGRDPANRQQYISQLMEHVRLPLLSQEYLVETVGEENLIKTNIFCKDLLIEAMKFHLTKGDQKAVYKTPRTKPRTPIGLPKVLLVMGGQAPKAIRSVEVYDFKEEKWMTAAEMPSRRCRCGTAVLNTLVYAIGGFNGSLRVRTVDVYDPAKDAWTTVASMEARRSTLGAAVLGGLIYAVGGFDGTTGLNSAEYYDPRTNEWRMISPMSTRRSSVGVGVVGHHLYAVGGYDGASRHCLSSVECYSPEADIWAGIADMSCRRSGAGVGVLEGLLYAVGGHDGPLVRKSVEAYNPEINTWSQVANMHLARRNAGVVAHGGFLWVIGGDDGISNLGSVEFYNPKTDTWTLLPSNLQTGRSYASVAVVDKPL
ncbi:kelch-like protein 3 [Lingula anatina]|uniref:Kelch-like protein 3 n=1 Tax=Lingula anatina TaxID=7574 RepID=A0A1S3IM45_LINAN|nr:kelch-like protein 3 [Lingula anatina]|eukprot:XP_013399272.1 kelch-like protein 3 [Lingula anatina]